MYFRAFRGVALGVSPLLRLTRPGVGRLDCRTPVGMFMVDDLEAVLMISKLFSILH